MRDDAAFQSQQFREGVEQRRDRYSAQRQEAWRSMPDATVGEFQRQRAASQQFAIRQAEAVRAQQQHDMDMTLSAGQLAFDEIRRKEAVEKLAFAKELHSTDMIALQKRQMQAQTDYEEARLAKARKDLEGADDVDLRGLDPDQMMAMWATGVDIEIDGNRVRYRKASDEKQGYGKRYIESQSLERNALRQQQLEIADRNVQARETYNEIQNRRVTAAAGNTDNAISKQAALVASKAFFDLPDDVQEKEVERLAAMLRARRGEPEKDPGGSGGEDEPFTVESFVEAMRKAAGK